jgi:hypothetical protein
VKRLALAGCVVGLLLFGANSASAETVSLGSQQNTSGHPEAWIFPETLERAESFVVTITAEPTQVYEYKYYVSCRRGSESISYQGAAVNITPPFTTTLLPTLAEPDSCSMEASVEVPFEGEVPGTVKIEVTGNRRPAPAPALSPSPTPTPTPVVVDPMPTPRWVKCSAPAFLKSGATEDNGGGCAEAQTIATKAWRSPARLGKYVKVSGFYCRRSQQGREVTILCADADQIIKVKGRLR